MSSQRIKHKRPHSGNQTASSVPSVSNSSTSNKHCNEKESEIQWEMINVELPRSPYKSPTTGDRFIPQRTRHGDYLHYKLISSPESTSCRSLLDTSPPKERYKQVVAKMLFQESPSKILSFRQLERGPSATTSTQLLSPSNQFDNCLKVLYSQNKFADNSGSPRNYRRYISPDPERVLDAPEIIDDYYLNLLDWSSENVLSVALCQAVYLWHAGTGQIQQVRLFEEHFVVSTHTHIYITHCFSFSSSRG
jgi:hypothetical protein